ncbi:MAG: hypothetical protein GY810_16925 [Aureispira sp.]|nr:hypothetical protein [Aureispira sp.]
MSAQHLSPLVLSHEALQVHQGEFVYLVGTYKELNVAKKHTVTRYVGRAYLELLGGGHVVIETDEDGIRSPEEIEKYRDKTVLIYGRVMVGQTVWGGGQLASLVMSAVRSFKQIDLANPNDFVPYIDRISTLPEVYLKEELKEEYIGNWVRIEGKLSAPKSAAQLLNSKEAEELSELGIDTSFAKEMAEMQQHLDQMNELFSIKSYKLNTAIELPDLGSIKIRDTQPSELLDSSNIGSKLSIIGRLQGIPPYGCYLTEIQKVKLVDSNTTPLIKTDKDIKRHDSTQVIVIGTYYEIDVAQHPARTVYIGRAALRLEDGSSIAIEVDDKGVRSKQEINRCKGKQVKIVGTLHSLMQLWGSYDEAAIVSPALTDIQSIEVVLD